MPTATLTSKGQITIPKSVREFLGIRSGDAVDFTAAPEGQVILRPVITDVTALRGLLKRTRQKPVSIEQMNQAIRNRFRKFK